ncbi:YciI family protein [Streptomyces hokutonensis]|uniref:YciI family protein n=1 Tax=Streptomyces hokutonensis TaxID=1306990 RepID=UPI00381B685F
MWHLTLHRWTRDRGEAMKLLEDHLAWMRGQQLAGNIIAAGPTPDRELGIVLFRHMSRQEVDEICRDEPFIAGGYRDYEVVPWEVHHLLGIGGFDIKTITAMTEAETQYEPGDGVR